MAATYAKGLPQAVSAFAHAADRLTPEQQQQHDLAALQSSFRADASSSSASASDFSRFAQQHAGPSSSSAFQATGLEQPRAASAWERSQLVATGRPVSSAIPAQSSSALSRDGDALVALLNGHESVVDAVDGDWERELAQDQQRSSALVSPLLADPLASKADSQQPDTRRVAANPGDMSPTSESLLASVSNLSLAEQTYLRTLLASQDPAAMFQDYFSHGTYTDDVWTPITSGPLRDVLDRAAEDTGKGKGKERVEDEEGKAKAVRRLEMLLRHLNGQIGSTAAVTSLSTSGTRAGRLGGGGNAANQLPNSTALSSVADSRAASDASAHASYSTTATSTSFAAPSSLSSSAFVSFSPQSVAVHSPATLEYNLHQHHRVAPSSAPSAIEHIDAQNPPVATPYDHHRSAAQPRTNSYAASSSSGKSNGTDASYEEYAKEKEARMRSNEGGRFGPDFSSMRSLYGSGAGGGERGGEAMADVTEGRTH